MKSAVENTLAVLQSTGTLLEAMGRPSQWMVPSEALPAHLLLIQLAGEQGHLLQISCLDELLKLPEDTPTAPWIQCSVLIPLETHPTDPLLLAQLLVRLNQALLVGSFGLSEADGVHYTYRLPWHAQVGPVQIAQSIQLMELGLALGAGLIAKVGAQQLSLEQAQFQLEQKLLRLARSGPQS